MLKLLQFANSLPSDRIRMFMAPGKSGYSKNISYWILDNVAFSMQLAAKLPDLETPPAVQPVSASVPVSVPSPESEDKMTRLREQVVRIRILNGDGEKGIGKRAAQIFQRIGIEVPYTGNARHYDYHTSNIIYPPGAGEEARQGALALAELCGITNPGLIREDRRAESLTLILGHDKDTILKRLASLSLTE
jgi:hypothetical protein